MPTKLMFWKALPAHPLSADDIGRELVWGEEVDGLVDLPVKEILDRLKAEFAEHLETPGLLVIPDGGGRAEATWTWQHLRFELHEASDTLRERLVQVLSDFGCSVHEMP
ncbi:MAG: hypothetical protein MUF06_15805 [Pirellulaceae bacterium]|jgi:hypothetical protein|nr:hypothetical protein [Pirellulaceae bacterium]